MNGNWGRGNVWGIMWGVAFGIIVSGVITGVGFVGVIAVGALSANLAEKSARRVAAPQPPPPKEVAPPRSFSSAELVEFLDAVSDGRPIAVASFVSVASEREKARTDSIARRAKAAADSVAKAKADSAAKIAKAKADSVAKVEADSLARVNHARQLARAVLRSDQNQIKARADALVDSLVLAVERKAERERARARTAAAAQRAKNLGICEAKIQENGIGRDHMSYDYWLERCIKEPDRAWW